MNFKYVASSLLGLALLFGSATSTFASTRYYESEPNDTKIQANIIGNDGFVLGDFNGSSDTVDYYKFTAPITGSLKIYLNSIPQGNDFDLYFENSYQTLASSTNSSNTSEFIIYNVTAGRDYYIKVNAYTKVISGYKDYYLYAVYN